MSCANDHFLLDPTEAAKARRFASEGLEPISMAEDKLKRDEVLVRIGHSNLSYQRNLSSPWWMTWEIFHNLRVAGRLLRPELRPEKAFRKTFHNKLAVAHSFGLADTIVRVRLKERLRVLRGRGRYISDTTSASEPIGWIGAYDIAQIFIPGLRLDDGRTMSPLCEQVFSVEAYMPVSAYFRRDDAFA